MSIAQKNTDVKKVVLAYSGGWIPRPLFPG